VQEQINKGSYDNAGEIIQEALMLLRDQQDLREIGLARLKREIQKRVDDAEQGRTLDAQVVYKRIKAKLAEMSKRNLSNEKMTDS
jgi:Arc/MetJ-type ribon-helix-helix transcriptional regulator